MVESINTSKHSLDQLFENLKEKLPPILSIGEACEIFKISRATINRWRSKGLISSFKGGNNSKSRVVILTEEMLNLLERNGS